MTINVIVYLSNLSMPIGYSKSSLNNISHLILFSYSYYLFSLSISNISYVIINSVHVVKENVTCLNDPFYDQYEKMNGQKYSAKLANSSITPWLEN